MTHRSRILFSVAPLLLGVVLLGGCAGQPVETTPAPSPTETTTGEEPSVDAGDDQSFVENKCTLCHSYERVDAANYDNAGWTEVVTRMQQNGLVITDEEKTRIVEYLTAK